MKYESPTAASPCVHQQLRRCRWESCVCCTVGERRGHMPRLFQCESKIDSRGRGAMHLLCQAAYTQKNKHTHTHTHIAEVSMACGKCLCVTGCRGNIFCVRFMHCAKVGRVKGLRFECCRDPFSRRVDTQRKATTGPEF